MHRTFRKLLPDAVGQNQWVAAVNADIRGFTSSMSGDPAESALYLRRVYTRILENYFEGYSFFKPTGDGLLLVIPFDANEDELARVSSLVVADAVRLVADFPNIVAGDKLVQFPHPKAIGGSPSKFRTSSNHRPQSRARSTSAKPTSRSRLTWITRAKTRTSPTTMGRTISRATTNWTTTSLPANSR